MLAGWPCIRLNDEPNIKLVDLFSLVGTGQSYLSLGHSDFNCWYSFAPELVVKFHTLGFSGCHNTFLSSPHL